MKVLHIIPTLASGGAEKMLVDLVEEMKKAGVWVEVLVLSDSEDFYSERIRELKIPIHFSPINKVYHLLQVKVIKDYLSRDFDIVHAHLFAPQLYVAYIKQFMGGKTVLITTEHNTHNRRREKKYFKFIDSWMYKKYTKIIANTEGTKEEMINYLPKVAVKTVVVHNGIRIKQYLEAKPLERKELVSNYRENDILIVMVAAMREQKDYETLIRASALLPENYHILLVGIGERLTDVKEYAKEYGTPKISFLGRRSDVPSILKSCDIFVLSSKWEGFGLVAVEAMSADLPIIVSDVAGLREVVEGVGTFFEVGNEEDLKRQILNTPKDRIEGKELNSEKKQKMILYSIEKMASNYLRIYREVTGEEKLK
ncbi:glycosyltransferase [Sporosarcina sp. E16_8]|uniref:glycosyltransferase n=1 Tax=Sporosarcina sp. E16_8 TaxID=2789295 RepID=UPI001A920C0B|nr:glycosyltransferase [Sporosarcina sp. E16_8]MBO0588602.1 glycosyltransferase [Sporosarcina sp. E16_8]